MLCYALDNVQSSQGLRNASGQYTPTVLCTVRNFQPHF